MIGWSPVLEEPGAGSETLPRGAPGSLPPFADEAPVSLVRSAAEVPVLLGIAALVAFLLKTFVAQAFYIPSGSMIPELMINDRVVVSKVSYHLHPPHRGDILVFDAPPHEQPPPSPHRYPLAVRWLRDVGEGVGVIQPSTSEFIKRVIGLPGDTVEGRAGRVYVDGHLLAEPYLPPGTFTSDFGPVQVPPGRLWVMGDNRTDSCDSRCFPLHCDPGHVNCDPATIAISKVVGRALVRVWPVRRFAFL